MLAHMQAFAILEEGLYEVYLVMESRQSSLQSTYQPSLSYSP